MTKGQRNIFFARLLSSHPAAGAFLAPLVYICSPIFPRQLPPAGKAPLIPDLKRTTLVFVISILPVLCLRWSSFLVYFVLYPNTSLLNLHSLLDLSILLYFLSESTPFYICFLVHAQCLQSLKQTDLANTQPAALLETVTRLF